MPSLLRALITAGSTLVVLFVLHTTARADDPHTRPPCDPEVIVVPMMRASWIASLQYANNSTSDIVDGSVLHGRFEFPLLEHAKNDRIGLAVHDGVFFDAAIPYPDKSGFFTTAYAGVGYEALAGIRTARVGFLLGLRAEASAWAAPNGGFYSFVLPIVLRVEAYFYDKHDRPYVLTAWASMLEQPFFDLESPGKLILPSRVMGGRLDVPVSKQWSLFGSIQNAQGTQVLWRKAFDGEGRAAWETRFGISVDLP